MFHFNKRQYLYIIPEKIFFDEDLSLNELRVYAIIRSGRDCGIPISEIDDVFEEKLKILPYLSEEVVRKCINRLIEKEYIISEEGYLSPINKYLLSTLEI
jgi:hypothetical protein